MFSDLIVDLPLAVVGYALAVFVISRFTGVHGVSETPSVAPTRSDDSAKGEAAPTLESTTETWTVDHEPEVLTELDADDLAIFDPTTMIEFDEDEVEPLGHLPSDAVLRRHFLHHLMMMLDTLYPEPTEAQQRRHHAQYLAYRMEELLGSERAVLALEAEYEARGLNFN
jgi:hypothetical protein